MLENSQSVAALVISVTSLTRSGDAVSTVVVTRAKVRRCARWRRAWCAEI